MKFGNMHSSLKQYAGPQNRKLCRDPGSVLMDIRQKVMFEQGFLKILTRDGGEPTSGFRLFIRFKCLNLTKILEPRIVGKVNF